MNRDHALGDESCWARRRCCCARAASNLRFGFSSGALPGVARHDEPHSPRGPSLTRLLRRASCTPVYDVSDATPTSKQRRTFHSRPPGIGEVGAGEDGLEGVLTGVPTRTWNAGLASEGISSEKVVRRVFSVNEECDSACARRKCLALEGGDNVEGNVSCDSRMAESLNTAIIMLAIQLETPSHFE